MSAEYNIVLDGSHKYSPGDDPAWSLPTYEDSKWQSIIVPGSWQSQGTKSEKGIGWYRIHFAVTDGLRNMQLAILLGRIGDTDEVFLNGVRIGGEGLIGERFVEATKVNRLYIIPSGLLKYKEDNLLSIRVMNTYLNGGIFDRDIIIGDYNHLLAKKLNRDKYVLVMESCFFTFFAIFFVTCLFFYVQGLRDREYIYFWLFITAYGTLFFLGSLAFYNTGMKTVLVQHTINTLAALLPASLIMLLMRIYHEETPSYIKPVLLIYFLIAPATVLFPEYPLRGYLNKVWGINFILTAVFLVFSAMKAYRKRFYESGYILSGVTGLIAGLVLESVGGVDLLQVTGFFLWDYSAVFFMICLMCALTARYVRIREELQSASVRIFDAHEEERGRLARELHDGIGPSLLAIKLRLRMLEAKAREGVPIGKEEFPELISDISNSIEELRTVAMDLRPSFLENVDITDAVNWHAEKIKEKLGIQIKVASEELTEIAPKTKDTIYRIYQEALSNSIKHSGATMINVVLKMKDDFLSLEIRDNGKGFDPGRQDRRGKGLGLYTMRERVELLSGIFSIKSSERTGTSIYIEVPVK